MDDGLKYWKRLPPKKPDEHSKSAACEPKEIDFTKPLFLCFGGFDTSTPKVANDFTKLAQMLLGNEKAFATGVQLIATQYAYMAPARENDPIADLEFQKQRTVHVQRYSADVMKKVFDRDDVIPHLHGLNPVARQAALKRCDAALSHVNILAYSFGTYLARQMHEDMRHLMQERGFTEEEGAAARGHLHVVTFGDMSLWKGNVQEPSDFTEEPHPPWDFTSVHFASSRDRLVQRLSGITPELLEKNGGHARILRFGKKRNVLLFIDRLPENKVTINAKKQVVYKRVDPDAKGWEHGTFAYCGMDQESPATTYVSREGGQWFMPSALQTAMRNCLHSSLHGDRGNAAAFLNPVDLSQQEGASGAHLKIHFMPGHTYYPYASRIQELIERGPCHDKLPGQPAAWAQLISGKQDMQPTNSMNIGA